MRADMADSDRVRGVLKIRDGDHVATGCALDIGGIGRQIDHRIGRSGLGDADGVGVGNGVAAIGIDQGLELAGRVLGDDDGMVLAEDVEVLEGRRQIDRREGARHHHERTSRRDGVERRRVGVAQDVTDRRGLQGRDLVAGVVLRRLHLGVDQHRQGVIERRTADREGKQYGEQAVHGSTWVMITGAPSGVRHPSGRGRSPSTVWMIATCDGTNCTSPIPTTGATSVEGALS